MLTYVFVPVDVKPLDVAKTELLEKTHIHLNIIRQKTSRKITHLKIEFIESDPLNL